MGENDPLELIDYLRAIWRWKRAIIIFSLACSVVAGIISFSMPKIYEVSMVMESGVIDIKQDGKFIYLDSASNIKSKIDSHVYNSNIYKRLNADPRKKIIRFKTMQPINSSTIRVWLETKDVSEGIQLLSILFNEIRGEYQHYIDTHESNLDERIAINELELNFNASEKNRLQKEIAEVGAYMNRIIEEKSILISKGGHDTDKSSLLIYANIVQQNLIHYNNLKEQINQLTIRIEKIKPEIDTLKLKRQFIKNIKLVQQPQSSTFPIKPKSKFNIILAFISGLIFSIFLVCLLEYIRRMKL